VKSFVLDASVTLAWLIDKSTAPYAAHVRQLLLRGSRALVPALWQWEVANGFVSAEQRGVLTSSDTTEMLQAFEKAIGHVIEIRSESASIQGVVATARESRLTAYDAAYLALAREQQLPIATLDRSLAKAAREVGVALLH